MREAWITRTKDLPAGVVRLSLRTLACPPPVATVRAATVYARPACTVTLAVKTGLLDAEDPADRILTV